MVLDYAVVGGVPAKVIRKIAELDKNERYYHRTDEQLVQFAGWRPTFEKA